MKKDTLGFVFNFKKIKSQFEEKTILIIRVSNLLMKAMGE